MIQKLPRTSVFRSFFCILLSYIKEIDIQSYMDCANNEHADIIDEVLHFRRRVA